MKEKQAKKTIIKIICFLIIGYLLLSIVTRIFVPKWIKPEDNRMSYIIKEFYEEPNGSIDVIFMGNSDVYRGISPITLWDEYGIASYNFVSSGQRMWTAYYLMEESLKYQKTKLIVLNMDSVFNESECSESNYRKVFDNLKFSKNKIKAITDKTFGFSKKEILTYFLPILRFHSRWSELNDDDFKCAFKTKKYGLKGMDLSTDIKPFNNGENYMNEEKPEKEIGPKCSEYMDKMIKLCKENNIELLLIELPSAESWSYYLSNKTQEFADKYGLEFIDMNLNYKEFGFDWQTDTSDEGDHLNVYGAEKVSKYLGKIIQEKYNIKNRKDEKEYEDWNNSSKIYHEKIEKEENDKLKH